MDETLVREKVLEVTAKVLRTRLDEKDLKKTIEDLGGDSLDQVDMMMTVETELEIEIPEEALEDAQGKSLAEISKLIAALKNPKQLGGGQ